VLLNKLKLIILLVLFLLAPTYSYAQTNPCNQQNLIDSVAVNISTATTTRLVQNDATADNTTRIQVCSFTLTIVGTATANTLKYQYGTGATCGTGTTDLTGPLTGAATAGVPLVVRVDSPPFKPVPKINNLCAITSQAGVIAGVLRFVKY
jgi:hypothetical protein